MHLLTFSHFDSLPVSVRPLQTFGCGGDGGERLGGGGEGDEAVLGALASQYVTTPSRKLSHWSSAPLIWRVEPHEPQLWTRLVPEPVILVQLVPAVQPPVQDAPM